MGRPGHQFGVSSIQITEDETIATDFLGHDEHVLLTFLR